MALKAIFFYDEECGLPCDDALEGLKEAAGSDEVEKMSIREGLQRFDLGNPEGVPFIGLVFEATGKCIGKTYFHDHEGHLVVQPYPSVAETGASDLGEAEQHGETDKG